VSDGSTIEVLPVAALRPGMFVCGLDRPWLETPFLMQGFQIEAQHELDELRRLCREVRVDWSRSTAAARMSPSSPAALSRRKKYSTPLTLVNISHW